MKWRALLNVLLLCVLCTTTGGLRKAKLPDRAPSKTWVLFLEGGGRVAFSKVNAADFQGLQWLMSTVLDLGDAPAHWSYFWLDILNHEDATRFFAYHPHLNTFSLVVRDTPIAQPRQVESDPVVSHHLLQALYMKRLREDPVIRRWYRYFEPVDVLPGALKTRLIVVKTSWPLADHQIEQVWMDLAGAKFRMRRRDRLSRDASKVATVGTPHLDELLRKKRELSEKKP